MVTARAFPEDLVAGFKAGASDYVAKPVIREEFYARLELHLSLSRVFVARELHNTRLRLVDAVLALIGVGRAALPELAPIADDASASSEQDEGSGGGDETEDLIQRLVASLEQGQSGDSELPGSWRPEDVSELRETLAALGREHTRLLADFFARSSPTSEEAFSTHEGTVPEGQDFSRVLEKLFKAVSRSASEGVTVDAGGLGLSDREADIVRLVCEGYGNQEIARLLGITENTVKRHLYNTFNKLGVDTRAQLIYKVLARP
jgi:DNA-binding NarL/FixJ family response regulator